VDNGLKRRGDQKDLATQVRPREVSGANARLYAASCRAGERTADALSTPLAARFSDPRCNQAENHAKPSSLLASPGTGS